MEYKPHNYQVRATEFIIEHRYCALFLDMGLGKTVATLTAVQQLLEDYLEVQRVLVIAPKSVALNTWPSECRKWDHLRGLRVSVVAGTKKAREAALKREAEVFIISRDNVADLATSALNGGGFPFDMVVVDESTSFKNPRSKRFKALRKVRPYIRRMVLLTGTPSPNTLMDLWPQMWLLDRGERLGRTLTAYRERWFKPGRRNGAVVYEWNPQPGAREEIARKIADVCMSLKAHDYITMPDMIEAGTEISLLDKYLIGYRDFERKCLLDLDGETITAETAAALSNKLLQYTGGAVYDAEGNWHEVNTAKLDALHDIAETAGEPLLVYCAFRHEEERILRDFPDAVLFRGEPDILKRWNAGEVPMLVCHPASVAYGLNMQQGGRIIVWYSTTWSLELYQQANARLHRQGQTRPVLLCRLVARGTIDERVCEALEGKTTCQEAILQRIRELRSNPEGSKICIDSQ